MCYYICLHKYKDENIIVIKEEGNKGDHPLHLQIF